MRTNYASYGFKRKDQSEDIATSRHPSAIISSFYHDSASALIIDGKIEKIALNISTKINKIIDVKNSFVSLGWVDLFSNFCDPGFEHKENLISGRKVAASGGYTDICILPNTNPIIDSKSGVEYLTNKNHQELVQIHPIGAISQHCEGKKLAEMYDMKNSGAIAFSDGKKTINNPALLLKALQYVKPFDGLIIQIPQEESIAKNGLMHESENSTKFGLSGIPTATEIISLQRDIELNNYCESKIHFTGISSKEGVEIIKNAKKKNKQITCSTTPHHLNFCDEDLENYDSNFKINPPLRSKKDHSLMPTMMFGRVSLQRKSPKMVNSLAIKSVHRTEMHEWRFFHSNHKIAKL